ncbi:hypothetical protein SteCoe_28254 [Stentor coeruleus]|uniref:Uncharacterized protein n=1 Tax=Stentor coeruleus TaxID=5963 RepID=A0A1R2B8L7_9CILI|nr:hypothetical protein SteCoe_28254 [Stentor coeruleus]
MSTKKGRQSKLFFEKNRVKKPNRYFLDLPRHSKKTPSPESIILVNNKLDLLDSFKCSFQVSKSQSRYLTPIQSSRTKIPPGNLVSLNVNHYGLGNARAKILSTAIRSMDRLKKINLKGNGIIETGASSILNSINRENILTLDLSSNRIGTLGIDSLCSILKDDYCTLEDLNIERIQISTSCLKSLCSSLKHNKSLKKLNLANNNIGSGSGIFLAEMIDYNNTLEKLDLQWNYIKGPEAITICKALQHNNTIKILDFSWNSLGQDRINDSIKRFSYHLFLNKSIKHLDLSNNNFSAGDCKILSETIKVNHKIKGLHFEGNSGIVNALGYIETREFISSQSDTNKGKNTCNDLRSEDIMCWICHKWTDVTIEWDPSCIVWNRRLRHFALFKLSSQTEPVYIHFEIDNYEPFLLQKTETGIYKCTRSVPKGKTRFFFTYRGVGQISNQYSIEAADPVIEKNVHFYAEFSKKVLVVVVNCFDNENSMSIAVPRPIIDEYQLPPGDFPEPDIPLWNFENSIFAGYIQDTPELLNKCFEADWANSKLHRLMKNDSSRSVCKEIVRREYQKM